MRFYLAATLRRKKAGVSQSRERFEFVVKKVFLELKLRPPHESTHHTRVKNLKEAAARLSINKQIATCLSGLRELRFCPYKLVVIEGLTGPIFNYFFILSTDQVWAFGLIRKTLF